MEEYVIKHSEIEGHFQYFQDRKSIWDIIKNSEKLSQLLVQLESQYSQLKREYFYKKKADAEILIQIAWQKYLSDVATDLSVDNSQNIFHYCSITNTIGNKH